MALTRVANGRHLQVSGEIDFGIADPVVPVELWDQVTTNRFRVSGALTLDGTPVSGAVLKANTYTIPEPTAEDGSFDVVGDKTVLERTIVTVSDLSNATVGGSPIEATDNELLLAAETTVESAFVLTLDSEPALVGGTPDQKITGTLTFADGTTPIPAVNLWGYHLSGNVVDTSDAPIEGAYVSVRDDEGETWALSGKTNASGEYVLRFYPIGGSQFTVRVAIGMDSFQSESEVQFADETSATMDIRVDSDVGRIVGTGAEDAFDIVDVVGAEYVGYMTGLAIGNKPIPAATTWPDESGAFRITIPTIESGAELSFFQARLRFFHESGVTPGGDIDPAIVPAELDPQVPSQLPPVIITSGS